MRCAQSLDSSPLSQAISPALHLVLIVLTCDIPHRVVSFMTHCSGVQYRHLTSTRRFRFVHVAFDCMQSGQVPSGPGHGTRSNSGTHRGLGNMRCCCEISDCIRSVRYCHSVPVYGPWIMYGKSMSDDLTRSSARDGRMLTRCSLTRLLRDGSV